MTQNTNEPVRAVTQDFVHVSFPIDGASYTFLKSKDPIAFQEALLAVDEGRYDDVRAISQNSTPLQKLKSLEIEELTITKDGRVLVGDAQINNFVTKKIIEFVENDLNPISWINFLKSALRNPHAIAVDDLFQFLQNHEAAPITSDGAFLAYKKVDNDFLSFFSGKCGKKEDWAPGKTVALDRSQCEANRDITCAAGLHFCSKGYLPHFYGSSGKVVMVKIFPEDVVSIPTDYNLTKGRCCKAYSVCEIEDLQNFAFGLSYTTDGFVHASPTLVAGMSSATKHMIEAKLKLYLELSDDEGTTYSISDFVERVDEVLAEEGEIFAYDEEEVLQVLANTTDAELDDIDYDDADDDIYIYV